MTITADWPTKVLSIPQADLTLISGTLYELDTEVDFRQAVNALMASEEGIVFEDPIDHNTSYSVTGVTYARKIEVINGYSILFTPDSQYSVRLAGSNNNLFDIENGVLNQNQVQIIGQNSAGLIETQVSGLTAEEAIKLKELWQLQGLDVANPAVTTPVSRDVDAIEQVISGDGETISTVTRQP